MYSFIFLNIQWIPDRAGMTRSGKRFRILTALLTVPGYRGRYPASSFPRRRESAAFPAMRNTPTPVHSFATFLAVSVNLAH